MKMMFIVTSGVMIVFLANRAAARDGLAPLWEQLITVTNYGGTAAVNQCGHVKSLCCTQGRQP